MDKKPIKDKQAEVNRKIDEMVQSAKDKIKLEEADYILTAFKHELEGIGKEAQVALDNALNNGAIRSCQSIIENMINIYRN